MHELQLLVQSLTKKVGEAEERYSLLQEQTESLKELLATEKKQFSQKETMYKQNVGVEDFHDAAESLWLLTRCEIAPCLFSDPNIQRHHPSER